MQAQKSLTLHWRLFSAWGRENVAVVFAIEGSQYMIYGCLQLIATSVTQDANPENIDAPLMLIFRMGQWPYC